jgi:DNA-binding LacI/PurR family transcriptional regulator
MITLHDVALAAEVSVGTASKVLRHGAKRYRISESCRERVLAVSRKLGYRPNRLARSLQSGRGYAIGSLLGSLAQSLENAHLWGAMNAGMTAAALDHGYQVVSLGARCGQSPIQSGLEALDERRIDGLVVPPFSLTPALVKQLEARQAPIVLMAYPKPTRVPVVEVDDTVGVIRVVEHLISLGHWRFLWVGPGDARDYYEKRRRTAFQAVMDVQGIKAHMIGVGYSLSRLTRKEDQIEATWAKLRSLPDGGLQKATAVVAYNEAVALGVYAAAAELGIRIPDDLSVASFDDFYAAVAWPPLTVVSLMMDKFGALAVETILEMLSNPTAWSKLRGSRRQIPCELILRKSTGPVSPRT